jgi:hypothetical protein
MNTQNCEAAAAQSSPIATIQGQKASGAHVETHKRELATDWIFAGVIVMTGWWYLRVSQSQSFVFDDWRVATRPLSFGDLFEPHNGHLSVVPLAIYRALLGEFGLETYTPYRVLGISSLLCLGTALFVFVRSRVGAPVALVVAVSVLWLPTTNLTPFLANFHIALVCAVVCAAAMPSVDRRSDIVVGSALAVALATSSVGVPVAAACGVYAVLYGRRPRRWIAVAVPSLLWLLWWGTLGDPPPAGASVVSNLGDVVDGIFGSFGALTGGWWLGGLVLLAGWIIMLMQRLSKDRPSAVTQLAWTAGLVVWWVGLVWSRPGAADSNNAGRYEYVGAVLILLSAVPALPVEWLQTTRARWRMTAPTLLIIGAIVLINHDDLRQAAHNRAVNGTTAEMLLYELEETVAPVEPTRRLAPELARITVQEYRKAVARYGSPVDLDRSPDGALIERDAVRVGIVGAAPTDDPTCAPGRATLGLGDGVTLHTGDEPATVRARRFGSAMVAVRTLPPHRSAVVRFPGPTIVTVPWVIDISGGCIDKG